MFHSCKYGTAGVYVLRHIARTNGQCSANQIRKGRQNKKSKVTVCANETNGKRCEKCRAGKGTEKDDKKIAH